MSYPISDNIQELLLRLLLAIVALAAIWVLRGLVAWLLIAPLRRYVSRTETQWDNIIFDALDVPVRYFVFILGLYLILMLLLPTASLFVNHFTRTMLILVVFMALYRAVGLIARSQSWLLRMTGLTIEERLMPFIRTIFRLILIAIALVILIQEWGYDVGGLVTALGLGGLAFSLAAQDMLANLFGFSAIMGDIPFVVGDTIKTPDVEGVVEQVGLRSTRVRRQDQGLVTVPNSKLANAAIVNLSRLSKRWLEFTLVIAYGAESSQIRLLLDRLRELLSARDVVQKDSIIVHLIGFGPNGTEILVRCFLLLADWKAFSREREVINLEILELLDALDVKLTASITS